MAHATYFAPTLPSSLTLRPSRTSVTSSVPPPYRSLQAALEAAAAAQRAAADAEEMAAQQHAAFALDLRRERERLKAEHQAEVAAVWSRIASATEAGIEPRDLPRDVHG